ncbi:hypothetical protein SLEP1_g45909 [Rubroshorea leprosula]|uniref:Uncharacterized protein n=1 Tax=Rubroshorea leprosula TaxID=152421 RepID=A0AAV5LLD2_9ROSI|nr:hypothetical protein SLEP1_g45909 [Rubroshorea leprosula]
MFHVGVGIEEGDKGDVCTDKIQELSDLGSLLISSL